MTQELNDKTQPAPTARRALRLGVAGPVGTGKSSLIAMVCRNMADELSLAVITNDIYTDEDARFLRSAGVLPGERIRAVETGACPHTAIRDDITMNLLAVEDLERGLAQDPRRHVDAVPAPSDQGGYVALAVWVAAPGHRVAPRKHRV